MTNNVGRIGLSEAYDYRVALPLIVVAILGLIFVDVSGHKHLTLTNKTASFSHKNLLKRDTTPSVNAANNLPALSNTVKTEDLAPGDSPFSVKTTSPQSSSTSSSSDARKLQNTEGSQSNSLDSSSSKQDYQTEVENIINGTTNQVINVTQGVNSTVKSLL